MDQSIVQQLVDMGFDQKLSQLAYQQTPNKQDIAQVIEYIQNNEEKLQKQLEQGVPENQNKIEEENNQQNQDQNQEQNQLKPISDMVDQEMSKQLQEMGHSKIVAEKSLFMTQAKKSVQAALDYIEEHKNDEDFHEELFISGQIQHSNLSPEEAKIKAKELQRELREKRAQQEEQADQDREKNRIKMEKTMRDAQEKIKEAQQERDIKSQVEERKKFQIEKQKMQEQLDRDYIERFGMEKFKIWKQKQNDQQKQLSVIEKTDQCIKALVTAHPQKVFPDKAKTALSTLKIYVDAIIKSPNEEKFRKINSQNAGFKKRVGDAFSGQAILESIGFVLDSEGFLVMGNPDLQLLQQVSQKLEQAQSKII